MAECIREHKVIIKKDHRCHGCLSIFPAKTVMTASVNVDYEGIYTLYLCEKCKQYIDTHLEEFKDDIYPGDFRESNNYIEFFKTS
jgi:hypothetical protein